MEFFTKGIRVCIQIEILSLDQQIKSFYLLKVSNRSTRTTSEIYSKLTIKTTEWRHWHLQLTSPIFLKGGILFDLGTIHSKFEAKPEKY